MGTSYLSVSCVKKLTNLLLNTGRSDLRTCDEATKMYKGSEGGGEGGAHSSLQGYWNRVRPCTDTHKDSKVQSAWGVGDLKGLSLQQNHSHLESLFPTA